jgi:hypothetical protein
MAEKLFPLPLPTFKCPFTNSTLPTIKATLFFTLFPRSIPFLQKLPQIIFVINENANLRCVIEGQDSRMNHFYVHCFDFSLMTSNSEKSKRLEILEE